jgi:hypothetical protein
LDTLSVEAEYRHHLKSDYESQALSALLQQYTAESTFEIDQEMVNRLSRRANSEEELKQRASHARLEPKKVAHKRIVPGLDLLPETDEHERHANVVRKTMICEDEPASASRRSCADRKADGECETNKSYMMFGCPRTCGLCSTDGKMCTNFFEHKCPEWKQAGECVEDPEAMATACRLACGWCAPVKAGEPAAATLAVPPVVPVAPLQPPTQPDVPTAPLDIQYTAQRAFAAGTLPDPKGSKGECALNDLPNGQLLARVNLTPKVADGPRVFCAIYTYEKNHQTNVKATIATWGKRCHGFLAFSTVDYFSLPAVKIEHEGPEEYDNMWQKVSAESCEVTSCLIYVIL